MTDLNDQNDPKATGGARSGTVVALNRGPLAPRPAPLRQIERYWERLRDGRTAPARAELDPRAIAPALEQTFLLERIAPGHGRFRLAGMHLNDLMGMEVRGMPLTAFFMPEARRKISDVLEEVFQRPATAHLTLIAENGIGKPPLEAHLLLLPLKSDLGDVSRVLGGLVASGRIGRTPRRFNASAARIRPVMAAGDGTAPDSVPHPAPSPARARTDTPDTTPVADHVFGFAEQDKPFRHGSGNAPRPYLRLVRSED